MNIENVKKNVSAETEMLPDPLELHQQLERSRGEVSALLQELGGFEQYQRDAERYVDGLSEEQITELAMHMREMFEGHPILASYKEFGIDPFAPDLTKHAYPHPIRFESQLVYDEEGKEALEDAGIGGYYDEFADEIVVYIPSEKNEPLLRQYLQNTVAPDDIKARLKSFLVFNHFGPLTSIILHESIHSAQRPDDFDERMQTKRQWRERHEITKELMEMQAFSEQMRGARMFNLFARTETMYEDREGKKRNYQSFREQLLDASPERYEVYLKQMAAMHGIGVEDMRPIFEGLMGSEKEADEMITQLLGRPQYGFDTDRLIVSLHVIDQFRALGFTEREIAHAIGEYGDYWQKETARYPALESVVAGKRENRGMDEEELETLTMCYKTNQRLDFNSAVMKSFSFMRDILKSKYAN